MTTENLSTAAEIDQEDVDFLRLQFTDILGTVKNVSIPADQAEKAFTDSVCCGNFRDHVTHIGVSRRVTDLVLHYDGKDSQQTL